MLSGQVNGAVEKDEEPGVVADPAEEVPECDEDPTKEGEAVSSPRDARSTMQEESKEESEEGPAAGDDGGAADVGDGGVLDGKNDDDEDTDDAYEDAEFAPPPLARGRSSSSVGAWLTDEDEESLIVDFLDKSTDEVRQEAGPRLGPSRPGPGCSFSAPD